MSFLKRNLSAVFLLLGCGLLGVTLLGFVPRQQIITQDGATLMLEAQPGMVVSAGNCVRIVWSISNIQTIMLDDQPTTGEGQQQVCLDPAAMPTFFITLPDGTATNIVVPVLILTRTPTFWLGLILIVVAFGRTLQARRSRQPETQSTTSIAWGSIALVLVSIGFTIGALELGLRYAIANSDDLDSQIMYLYSLDDIRALDARQVPMPYINYLPSPDFPEHNSLGYRGAEITLPKPNGTYRIVALGGSTTYSTGTDAANAYPALLQSILHDEYGYTHVEVINAGFQGYSTWESLVNLAFRVLELEPDMMIHYAAINDLAPREKLSIACYQGNNVLRGLNGTRGYWVEQTNELSPSALYRFIGINMGWVNNPLALSATFNPPFANCPDDGGLSITERLANNPPVYFERNLRSMIGIAQAHDVEVFLSTWAYDVTFDHPEHWQLAIAEHNTITREVAESLALPLIDFAETLPANSEMWEGDGVHMIASGTVVQAGQYAAFLVENDLIPAP